MRNFACRLLPSRQASSRLHCIEGDARDRHAGTPGSGCPRAEGDGKRPPPLAALHKLLASEPDAVSAWAAGFVQGAELARGAWRGAHRPVKAGAGAFGVLLQLAAQAAPSPAGWRAESDQNQPLLVGLEPDAPSPQARLSGALADLWQVIGPLRHARLAR